MVRIRLAGSPDSPPSTINNIAKARALEHDPSVIAPRTAEVVRARGHGLPRCSGDGGLVDHVVRGVGGGVAPVGGDVVAAIYDADVDAVEPGGGSLAEDEVGCAFDVALCVKLGTFVGEEGVLKA